MFMSLKEQLFQILEAKEQEMIEHRRHLHRHPELSFEEENTAKYIKSFYEGKDVTLTQPVQGAHAIIVEHNAFVFRFERYICFFINW